jgi:hypothetical protein
MKNKILLILLALAMLTLCACGDKTSVGTEASTVPTDTTAQMPTDESTQPETTETTVPETTEATVPATTLPMVLEEGFSFAVEGVVLTPGAAFDPSQLPQPNEVYQVPHEKIEGGDNVYCYDGFEVTAYNDGTGEVIYAIWLTDSNVATMEGLARGDNGAKVDALYGTNYEGDATARTYYLGNTMLSVLLHEDVVIDILYLWITG